MAAPSRTWSEITDGEIDSESGLTAALLTKYRDRQVHLKEVLYGTGSYTGDAPHDHDGAEDGAIVPFSSDNLLLNPTPKSTSPDRWTFTEFTDSESFGWQTGGSGSSARGLQTLFRATNYRGMFGAGAPLTCSLFIRATGENSAGVFRFGIGKTDVTDDFSTGHMAEIDYTSITGAWQRIYSIFDDSISGSSLPGDTAYHATDASAPCFRVRVSTSFTADIDITGFMVTVGEWLVPFQYSCIDEYAYNYEFVPEVPLFDRRVSLDEAVYVAPQ